MIRNHKTAFIHILQLIQLPMRIQYIILAFLASPYLYAEPQNFMRETIPFDDIAKSHNKLMMNSAELRAIAHSEIKKVILINAVTSATSDLDVYNIVEFLKTAEVVDAPQTFFTNALENRIWEAVIQTDSENFHLIISKASAYITSSKRYAFLKTNFD